MQTNTDFSVPDFFFRNEKLLFWISALLSLVFFAVGIYSNHSLYFIVPFGFVFLALTMLNFRAVFFIMLTVLPVSVESYIGKLGTDLPSEPMVILLAACTVFYLVFNKSELKQRQFQHPVFIIIMLMFIWSIFTTLFSTDIFLSVKYILAKFWYLAVFLVLPVLLLRTKRSIQLFFWCLFIPTYLSVLFVMVRHGIMGFTFDTITEAVHPIYRNHVNYAVFITMLFPFIFLAISWYPKNYLRYKILKYAIPVFLTAIFLSYTRGAWLAVGAMAVYFFVLKFNLTKNIIVVSGIFTVIFCAYILKDNNYLKYSPDYEHTIYHDELAQHLTSTFEMEDMSTVERFYRWIAAVKLFKENSIVGVGPNNFVSNYKKFTVTAYETYISDNEEKSTVHNYFLLLLTEQGLPALILFIVLITVVLLTAQMAYNTSDVTNRKYVMAITLCIIAFLLNNTLSDLVEANKLGSLFFMCLGLLVNFSSDAVQTQDEQLT